MISYVICDDSHCLGIFNEKSIAEKHIALLADVCTRHGGRLNVSRIVVHEYNLHILLNKLKVTSSFTLVQNDHVDSDINLFIPLETIPPPKPQLQELKEKIENLEKLKQKEETRTVEVRKTDEKYQEYIQEKAKLENLKKELKQDQEKWEEIEKKFEADKKLYFIFKNEIATGQRSEDNIPILFKDTYPLFKKLDEEKKLDNDDEIKNYLELTKYYKNTVFMTSEYDDLFLN